MDSQYTSILQFVVLLLLSRKLLVLTSALIISPTNAPARNLRRKAPWALSESQANLMLSVVNGPNTIATKGNNFATAPRNHFTLTRCSR